MKKILTLLLASVLGVTIASGQTKDKSNDEFTGHWFIGIQGGIGQTVGETSFGNLISPAASFNFGYQFTPVWLLRQPDFPRGVVQFRLSVHPRVGSPRRPQRLAG